MLFQARIWVFTVNAAKRHLTLPTAPHRIQRHFLVAMAHEATYHTCPPGLWMDNRVVGTLDPNKRPGLIPHFGLGATLHTSVHHTKPSRHYRFCNHVRHLQYVKVLHVGTEDDGETGTLVPVPPHHVYDALANQRGDDPRPAVLCDSLLLKRQGTLTFLVYLVDQREEVEGLVQDHRPRQFLARCVVEGVDLRVVVDPVADRLPAGRDNHRRLFVGPHVDHHKQVDSGKVGLHDHPVPGRSLGVAGSQNSRQYFGRVPIYVLLHYER